jgi:mono/diheme cytochrome c family protein
VLLCCSALVSAAGCSDTDPNYGPAGAITNYTPIQGGTTPAPAGDAATAADPKTAFKAVFDGTTGCAGCHIAGGAAVLAGSGDKYVFYTTGDVNASYTMFKAKNFHLANSIFYTKGLHNGPALTDAQKAAVDAWVKAEASGAGGG